MSKRPYLSKSIVELEAIYETSGQDKKTLKLITEELGFRTTQKAEALKRRISNGQAALLPNTKSAAKVEKATPIAVAESPRSAPAQLSLDVEPVVVRVPVPQSPSRPVQLPPVTNKATDILSAWTALEVLSPQGFKKETDIVPDDRTSVMMFERNDLPWEITQKSRPNKRLYFELYFGTVTMAPAVESLLKVYSDNRPERPSVRGYSPIASVILDKTGRPLEEDESAAISSFAWGVPVALMGDLRKLGDWTRQERILTAAFRERLIRRDRQNEIVPLTKAHIREVFEWLYNTLGLSVIETREPYFAVKRFEWIGNKNPPEPNLMNSFYLEDLAAARSLVDGNRVPRALSHYLGINSPPKRTDLFDDIHGLTQVLQPKLTPSGRWPGKGRYPLALLQQAAVNATGDDQMPTAVLGVNGPPGTGKTTLLRDVVAARVVERAAVMATFDRPAQAFEPSKVSFSRSGATITIHRLDNRLKGFEMVVASTNNKAVENVSEELPDMKAVAEDAQSLRYFPSISSNVLGKESWGVIAAVLGKSANRYEFSQSFWKDEENGLSTYLNHASGQPQYISIPQEVGPPVRRLRTVVERERPPQNAREAATRWEAARTRFREANAAFEVRQNKLQGVHLQMGRLRQVAVECRAAVEELQAGKSRMVDLEGQFASVQDGVRKQQNALDGVQDQARRHVRSRPGFFARLFKTAAFSEWNERNSDLSATVHRQEQALSTLKAQSESIGSEVKRLKQATEQLGNRIAELDTEKATLENALSRAKAFLGSLIPDDEFFGRAHEEIHLLNTWFDKETSILRDNVFEAAIHLHRAFIDCAADRLRQNLSIFMESFGTRSFGTPEKDALIPELWATFFLVVPLISTTFASVHRMFSRLKPEALGWLLVDEAGQAVPQAAVGAMMRTKRSIVVGDPLQIEPVVTLPNSLTEKVCGFFGIDPLRFNAPQASVQTLADAASVYCARFPAGSGHRDVGAPLLVHRRCNSPMFEISNQIAYANLMVHAKRQTPDNDTLGRSSWVHVVSRSSTDKWSPDEGATLIEMLRRLRHGGHTPDFYVVTPFVIVQDSLRSEILKSGVMDGWVKMPHDWLSKHVGTVHTVQGREAGIVFFVLGAPMASQNGARAWAGGRPNLVNVAVTRAQTTVYVIGNRDLWKSAGHFATLDRFLPPKT